MGGDVRVKICGLTTSADIPAALLAGASYLGFVFFPKSPRNVIFGDAAFMAGTVPEGITRVGLTVNAGNALLDEITAAVPLDMLQLHGSETAFRVAEVRKRYGLPVMKALAVAGPDDVAAIAEYESVADQILVDAKPPEGAAVPGGHGTAFDWSLLSGRDWRRPWMLAGGLTPANVAEAIRRTGARQVDVSSGVEEARGEKDGQRMADFVAAARG